MKLINRHKQCWGIMLHRSGQTTWELWFVPPHFAIVPHSHPNENIELYHVQGKCRFVRVNPEGNTLRYADMPSHSFFSHFSVPAGWDHWFSTTSSWLVFFNKAVWHDGVKPSSAAIDFKEL